MENSVFKRHLIRKAIVSGAFAVLTVGAIIGISVANAYIKPYEGFISDALCAVEDAGDNTALGDKLAVQIEEEGIVLAQNNNNVLPLNKTVTKVNVFGHSVIDWLLSNSGSGSAGPGSAQTAVGLLDALESYGIQYNQDIINYYESWCPHRDLPFSISSGYDNLYRLADPRLSTDTTYSGLYNSSKEFSNTAIVCLSRVAGEHVDPPHTQINNYKSSKSKNNDRGYLEITEEEEELLTAVGQDFENVIVVINASNVMQLDFMKTIEGLDSCLIVGPTGTVGARAIPKVLYGDVNPSGRTADTYPMKHWYNPTYYTSCYWPSNKGPYYTGIPSGANLASSNSQGDNWPNCNFADYQEGIYVGYRWYETADAEGFWEPYGGYDEVVAYPFGHGLSYTNFKWELEDVYPAKNSSFNENTEFTFSVKVTNTGEVIGRDVVELYLTAPYYDGEIEKSSVKLIGFQKTNLLAPGYSETVQIKAYARDFMSFDCYDADGNDFAGWELDRGEYEVKFMENAHVVKEGISPVKFRISETINVENDTTTGEPVNAIFTGEDAVDGISCDGLSIGEPIEYLSRANFSTFVPEHKSTPNANRSWNSLLEVSRGKSGNKAPNAYSKADAEAWDEETGYDVFGHEIPDWEPEFGKDYGMVVLDSNEQLTDLGRDLAADYYHDDWDSLLDQVTWQECVNIVNNSSSYNRPGVKSVGLRKGNNNDYKDVEAASQVGVDLDNKTRRLTAYPTPTVQAQCWNTTMPYLFGLSETYDMRIGGADASYGPASNIHRSPYGGRNSEYHSEDGFLAGCTLAAVTRGLADGGKSGFIKHFAVNDTEYHRVGLYTWLTEQALREVYLRPFEEAVKRGEANALMTSFNRVGATWAGGSQALIQGVLRNEWGFKGMTITDMIENSTLMDAQMHFRAGNNYILGGSGWGTGTGSTPKLETSTPRFQHRMRESAKQVIWAHIHALYKNYEYNTNPENRAIASGSTKPRWIWWKPALYSVEGIVLVGCILGIVLPLLPSNPEFREELMLRISGKKKKDAGEAK